MFVSTFDTVNLNWQGPTLPIWVAGRSRYTELSAKSTEPVIGSQENAKLKSMNEFQNIPFYLNYMFGLGDFVTQS